MNNDSGGTNIVTDRSLQEIIPLREDIVELKEAVKDLTGEIKKYYVTEKLYNSEQNSQNERLDNLEKNQKWVVCLILGGVILALLSQVILEGGPHGI